MLGVITLNAIVLGAETYDSVEDRYGDALRIETRVAKVGNREGILSAGSIGSPQILQLSGIGPADLLRHPMQLATLLIGLTARTESCARRALVSTS